MRYTVEDDDSGLFGVWDTQECSFVSVGWMTKHYCQQHADLWNKYDGEDGLRPHEWF